MRCDKQGTRGERSLRGHDDDSDGDHDGAAIVDDGEKLGESES